MFYLSQGPANAWPLAWLAPVPLLWLAFGDSPSWRLLAVSFLAFVIPARSTHRAVLRRPPPLNVSAVPPGAQTNSFFLSASLFASALIHRRLSLLPTLLAFPACWTAMEFVAGLLSPHGSFGSVAYSQVSVPILLQSTHRCSACTASPSS